MQPKLVTDTREWMIQIQIVIPIVDHRYRYRPGDTIKATSKHKEKGQVKAISYEL